MGSGSMLLGVHAWVTGVVGAGRRCFTSKSGYKVFSALRPNGRSPTVGSLSRSDGLLRWVPTYMFWVRLPTYGSYGG
jgi:hypothetical protein